MIEIVVECIKADTPTANNRIYSKETLIKMVELANKKIEDKMLFVTSDRYDYENSNFNDIIGRVDSCKFDERSGRMVIEVEQLKNKIDIAKLIESKLFRITPNTTAELDKNNNVINVEGLAAFSMMPEAPAIPKE